MAVKIWPVASGALVAASTLGKHMAVETRPATVHSQAEWVALTGCVGSAPSRLSLPSCSAT